jgi:OOP family OmpA-OmpF porin
MKRRSTRILTVVLLLQFGCGAIQRPSWNKPVGKGTWVSALVCGLAGAGAGVGVQEARRGCNTLPSGAKDCDDKDYWQGALIGVAAGAVLCGVLGHVFLDPTPIPTEPPPPPLETPTPEPTPPPMPPVRKRIVLRGVNFAFDSSEIRAESRPVLDEAVQQLAAYPDIALTVVGHTDSLGTSEYNEALSVRRAESVFRYLVNRGIAPERISVEGMGESSPVASNETEDGRAQNRRVELRVLEGN